MYYFLSYALSLTLCLLTEKTYIKKVKDMSNLHEKKKKKKKKLKLPLNWDKLQYYPCRMVGFFWFLVFPQIVNSITLKKFSSIYFCSQREYFYGDFMLFFPFLLVCRSFYIAGFAFLRKWYVTHCADLGLSLCILVLFSMIIEILFCFLVDLAGGFCISSLFHCSRLLKGILW